MGFLATVIRDGRGPAPRAPSGDGAPVDRSVAVPLDPAPPPAQPLREEPFGADPRQPHEPNTEGEYRDEGAGEPPTDAVDGARKVLGPSSSPVPEESDGPAWDLPVGRVEDPRGIRSKQDSAGSQADAGRASAAKGSERSDDAATTGHPGTTTAPVSPTPTDLRAEPDTSGGSPADPVEVRDSGVGDGSEPRAPDQDGAASTPARHTDSTGRHRARDVDVVEPDWADDPESVSAISPAASAPRADPTGTASPSPPSRSPARAARQDRADTYREQLTLPTEPPI